MKTRTRRLLTTASVFLTGGILAASVQGWAMASVPTPLPDGEQPIIHTAVLQEDDPGWDCKTSGNKSCDAVPFVVDAWASFDGVDVAKIVGEGVSFRASYYGTYSTKPSWDGYVAVASGHYPGVFHVFKIDL